MHTQEPTVCKRSLSIQSTIFNTPEVSHFRSEHEKFRPYTEGNQTSFIQEVNEEEEDSYKTHIAQQLLNRDKEAQVEFCTAMVGLLQKETEILNKFIDDG